MGFKVVIIGLDDEGEEKRETVFETPEGRRVTKVHVLTRSGESATIGVDPDQGDMALTFDYAPAGQLHVSDLDSIKLGYEPNLTGEEVAEREEKLNEIRGNSPSSDVFTQDAVDAQREAEEATAQAERDEPVNPDDNRGDDLAAEKGETLPEFSTS